MNKGFDVIIEGRFLKMIGRIECFSFVKLYVFVEILTPNEGESKIRNVLVEREWEMYPHLPEKPVKNSSNRQGVGGNFISILIVLD
jgi:hypothetical protein